MNNRSANKRIEHYGEPAAGSPRFMRNVGPETMDGKMTFQLRESCATVRRYDNT